jgi:hypothetical protein
VRIDNSNIIYVGYNNDGPTTGNVYMSFFAADLINNPSTTSFSMLKTIINVSGRSALLVDSGELLVGGESTGYYSGAVNQPVLFRVHFDNLSPTLDWVSLSN